MELLPFVPFALGRWGICGTGLVTEVGLVQPMEEAPKLGAMQHSVEDVVLLALSLLLLLLFLSCLAADAEGVSADSLTF